MTRFQNTCVPCVPTGTVCGRRPSVIRLTSTANTGVGPRQRLLHCSADPGCLPSLRVARSSTCLGSLGCCAGWTDAPTKAANAKVVAAWQERAPHVGSSGCSVAPSWAFQVGRRSLTLYRSLRRYIAFAQRSPCRFHQHRNVT